jgi:hypothetical protein
LMREFLEFGKDVKLLVQFGGKKVVSFANRTDASSQSHQSIPEYL